MYRISPLCYTGVTVLPSVIAEKHLLMADLPKLKTVITVFSAPGRMFSPEEIAAAAGISAAEAADSLLYWEDAGILINTEREAAVPAAVPEETVKEEKPAEKPVIDAKPTKYTHDMIAARTAESEDVRTLFAEAQLKLGRTIGLSDQSSLLLLMDYYGLPLEIILTICEYARTHGKANNTSYVYTIGVDWSKREIDTIERADEELKRIESVTSSWKEFCALTGVRYSVPTSAQTKYLGVWMDEWHFPMNVIVMAYEEMSKNTAGKPSFAYMNKVLAAWHKKGIKTPENVLNEQKEFKEKQEKTAAEKAANPYRTAKRSEDDGKKASYDIDRAANKAKTQVPILKKKEKR